jgi:hypothetical protein
LLLKIGLFGSMERIRSTRALEKACLQIMPFLWLTGNLHLHEAEPSARRRKGRSTHGLGYKNAGAHGSGQKGGP